MRLLLLAGSGEARTIATALAAMEEVEGFASLAGATSRPAQLALPTRIGGFGGDAAFECYLESRGIDAVLDATHPFAARVTARTARICTGKGLPHSILLRPEWESGPGDRWHFFDREEEVSELIQKGETVFLATGAQSLDRFRNLCGRHVICRQIEPPLRPFPFDGGEYLIGRPPFSVTDEVKLFQRLGVNWLVVKNSGGAASRSKLDAARELSIDVALQRRPSVPEALVHSTVEEALKWVRELT